MKCPLCGDGEQEMDEFLTYQSEQKHLEISLECPNPRCTAQFYGILYLTKKKPQVQDPEKG